MKSTTILIFFILLSFIICEEDKSNEVKEKKSLKDLQFEKDGNLIILNHKNFKYAVAKYKTLIVVFYSPVCPYSAKLLPEFSKAADILLKYNVQLAKVDAAADKVLAEEFQVQAFPMVMGFGIKVRELYYGKRKAANIVSWVLKKFVSPIQNLKTEEELEQFITENEVAFVFFGKDEKIIQVTKNASKKIDNFPFAFISDETVLSKYNAKEGMLILFKNTDEKKREMTDITEAKIIEFANKYAYPRVMNFSREVSELIFEKKLPALVYFDYKDSENFNKYSEILAKTAEKLDYKIKTVIADLSTVAYSQKLAEYIGIKKSQFPAFRILSLKDEEKIKTYSPALEEVTTDNLVKFVEDWEENKLKPDIKSQLEPKENNSPVVTLVGSNYKEKVLENDKDIMVVFYAPWCGHCKELHGIYEKLAERLKENKNLILAQIDSTENDVENVKIDGYPTILLYPGDKKNKTPIEYTGERNEDDMITFIKKYASNKLTIAGEIKRKNEGRRGDDRRRVGEGRMKSDERMKRDNRRINDEKRKREDRRRRSEEKQSQKTKKEKAKKRKVLDDDDDFSDL